MVPVPGGIEGSRKLCTMAAFSYRNRLAWLAIFVSVLIAAWHSLQRVLQHRLFAWPLPVDPPEFPCEWGDSANAASTWTIPAMLFLGVVAITILVSVRMGPVESIALVFKRLEGLFRAHPVTLQFFAAACVADFASTVHYFHEYGICDEMHPGIKLVTYAWGRTLGCLAAKLIQAGVGLLLCALLPNIARGILLVATTGYAIAAIWNSHVF